MRTRIIALAATLSIAGLAAASLASAAVPPGGGGASGGAVSSGGGGGTHGGGSGGGSHGGGGGFHGGSGFHGGGYGGARFSGGHFAGSRTGGGYRGGGYGSHSGYAAHASFMAHGGYIAHGSRGYHFVGSESAGLGRVGAVPRVGHGSRVSLALGPRMGSAAMAVRVGHFSRGDHMRPRPGHPGRPGHPHKYPKHHVLPNSEAAYINSQYMPSPPAFCNFATFNQPNGKLPLSYPCLQPVKAKPASVR